ncbi:MAG: hypothetical protein ACTSV5_15485 [Promethearchaeota archaeon]
MKKERLNMKFLDAFKNYDFSRIKEEKVFLVGSIRFKDIFIKIETILQVIHGKLVGICSVDGLLNKEKFSAKEWDKLQLIALKKLDDHDAILVLDVNGYIGDQSKEEIEYFTSELKRPVYWLSKLRK